jgi:hypothetical protein
VTSKQFLAFFSIGLAAVAAVMIPFNMYEDVYGLFRTSRGRRLSVYGEERVAKYLHSFRYIPENFDGVLLGSSVTDNFDTKRFPGYRIYNASIDGGNVEDLTPIADNVFRKGELKLTLICIHRYLTNDHMQRTGFMTPKQYWGALVSPQLITAYVSRLAIRQGVVRGEYDEWGARHYASEPDSATVRKTIDRTVAEIRRGAASVGNYHIDPDALSELDRIIAEARRGSRRLLIFYPPTPAPVLAVCSAEYARYREAINAAVRAGDILVDFNAPSYASLRSDYRNFTDAVHLSNAGAGLVLAELGRATQAAEAAETSGTNGPVRSAQQQRLGTDSSVP